MPTVKGTAETSAPMPAQPPLKDWIQVERERAIRWMLENISPEGAAQGSVAASQQRVNPNYWFHWVRDSGLTMKVIANLFRRAVLDLPNARKEEQRRSIASDRDRYYGLLMDYAQLSRRQQSSDAPAGLGEPKFEMGGAPFRGPWGRPQNDGPAVRATALAHFAHTLLMEYRDDEVRELLYRSEMPADTVIKADLEYVAHHWPDISFDAWEEVPASSHFYNAMVQRRSLIEGAHLSRALNDWAASRYYNSEAKKLEAAIERHWNEELGVIVPSLDASGRPGADGDLRGKTSHLDSLVIIGVVRGDTADEFMLPIDERVLATVARQEDAFRRLYPINQRPDIPGIAIGRYPEDVWFGGNPWMICTLAFAELYYLMARKYRFRSDIDIAQRALPFWRALDLPKNMRLESGETIRRDDPRFETLMRALHAKADSFLQRVRYHTDRGTGVWSEEMDRNTGFKVSAEKLTWNSAAYLRVLDHRREQEDIGVMIPASIARLGHPITTALDRIHFVFEGAGDVVRRYWGPALLKLRERYPDREVRVTLLDLSETWRGDPEREPKGLAMVRQFRDSGFDYFDKSKFKGSPSKLDTALKELAPDVVVIANPDFAHIGTIREWLARYQGKPPQIFVEKPLSNNTEDAFMLLGALAGLQSNQVHLVDHFRAMSLMGLDCRDCLERHLGGRIDRFRFWLVEDHSGADPCYRSVIDEDGAVEREGRDKTLREGLIYDLLSHMFPVADLVGDVLSFNAKWVRAAQYVGVGGDPDARPKLPADAETFADVGFEFRDPSGSPILGQAVIGKGLRGVRELGPGFDREVFAWQLTGPNGAKALFNLRADGPGASRAHMIDASGREVDSFELSAEEPYLPIVESIFNGIYLMNRIVLQPSFGFAILQIMDDLRVPIKRFGKPLPSYPGGMRGGRRESVCVEDLSAIAPLWGAKPAS